jgi:hypothetical protein
MALLKEVAARSASLFQAATSLSALRGQLGGALEGVRGLRGSLRGLDSDLAAGGVAVVGLRARGDNLNATLSITQVRLGNVCVWGGGGEEVVRDDVCTGSGDGVWRQDWRVEGRRWGVCM